MTAQPARGPLALVTATGARAGTSRRSDNVLRLWDPEPQLLGALMYLSAAEAAAIVEWVPDSAIWRPENRWAMKIIRDLVAQNIAPDPVTVLHAARTRGPMGVARVSARRHHGFAVHLADLYTQTVNPVLVRQYAREVLENAFARAVAAHGEHLAELARNGSSRRELAERVVAMRAELADLWRRAEAARPPVGSP